jgi:geranylgeranyl reductase
MKYYENLAEMYVGDDVSPDFYGWVFPKYDHVAVGTGTVVNKTAIKQYQQATRDRAKAKTAGGQIIRVEARPPPDCTCVHSSPRRSVAHMQLNGGGWVAARGNDMLLCRTLLLCRAAVWSEHGQASSAAGSQ